MKRTCRKRVLRTTGLSSAIAVTVHDSDVSAHTISSITVVNFDGTATTYVVNSSTAFTILRQNTTAASLVLGDNVRIVPSSTHASVAGSIDIVPAMIAGRVGAINGDTITVKGAKGRTSSIRVNTTTTYTKDGTSASLADVSVGSLVFGEGNFGSSPTTIDATSVGIGRPDAGEVAGVGSNAGRARSRCKRHKK
jgi:hypothetical protein